MVSELTVVVFSRCVRGITATPSIVSLSTQLVESPGFLLSTFGRFELGVKYVCERTQRWYSNVTWCKIIIKMPHVMLIYATLR